MWFIHGPEANVTAAMMSEHVLLSYKPTFSLTIPEKGYSEMMFFLNVGYNLFTTQVGVGHVFDLIWRWFLIQLLFKANL